MLSPTPAFTVVEKNNNSSLVYDHDSFMAFIQHQARKRNTKKLAKMLDVTEGAIQKMRQGDTAGSGPTITKWCMRDDDFRADYFRYCGGHVEANPALVKGVNAVIAAIAAVSGETHQ